MRTFPGRVIFPSLHRVNSSECMSHEQDLLDNLSSAGGLWEPRPAEPIARARAASGTSLRKGAAQRRHGWQKHTAGQCRLQQMSLKGEPRYRKNLNLLSFPPLALSGMACYPRHPPHG